MSPSALGPLLGAPFASVLGATLVALAVGMAGWRLRPRPDRVHDLVRQAATGRVRGCPPDSEPVLVRFPRVVGRTVRRAAGRGDAPEADRRLGRALVAGALVVPVSSVAAALAAGLMWFAPTWLASRAGQRRRAAIHDELPDVIDLLAVAVGAGANVRLAVHAVAPLCPGAVGAALSGALRAVAEGARLADALEPLRADDPLRELASCLIGAERDGAALGPSLSRLAADARDLRRRRAEEAARRLPVALLFPLVLCVLPAFGLLTVVPLLAGSLRTLSF